MATRKILFRGQTRRKGDKTSISGTPLPGVWVTGGIFPQNKGYERAIIYTQEPKVEKHVAYAETVGQYTGVDDVLETRVFEDDIITFWQRTDMKHMQRYKGIVKYDETLTSFRTAHLFLHNRVPVRALYRIASSRRPVKSRISSHTITAPRTCTSQITRRTGLNPCARAVFVQTPVSLS